MLLVRRAGLLPLLCASTLFSATRISEIDFKNFDYAWDVPKLGAPETWKWMEGTSRSSVHVVGGRHDFAVSESPVRTYRGGYLMVWSVTYGDLNDDGRDEAAVDLLFSTGGTLNWHYLYVFTLENGSPTLLGALQSGSRADGGLINVEIIQGRLVLDFEDAERQVAGCCSAGMIRVRYRLQGDHFVEVGERERDSLRMATYPSVPKGPQTVRYRIDGQSANIVYTDENGTDRTLTASGSNTEPDLSADKRSVVFLRRLDDKQREIWSVRTDGTEARLVYREAVRWNGTTCPSSTFRSPKWSYDGRAVYFVSDCTLTRGALWRFAINSRDLQLLIPEAVNYGVLHAGSFKGYLISNRRSLPAPDKPSQPRYPVYLFYLYAPDGRELWQVGDEDNEIEQLVAEWESR